MEAQAIGTKRDDAVRQCIEVASARRKEEFARRDLVWTADGYGYIVKFRLGLDNVVRTAVEMIVFEESSRMDRMLDGVRLTFKALASGATSDGGRCLRDQQQEAHSVSRQVLLRLGCGEPRAEDVGF
jgi:hypothetical protein